MLSIHVSLGPIKLLLQLIYSARTAFPHIFVLHRYFTMCTYVLLSPSDSAFVLADNETKCSVYLSTLCVTSHAYQCTLPLFVPIGRPSTLRFLGHHHHHQQQHHKLVKYMSDFTNQQSHSHGHFTGSLSLINKTTTSTSVYFGSTFNLTRAYQLRQFHHVITTGCDSHRHLIGLIRRRCHLQRPLIAR